MDLLKALKFVEIGEKLVLIEGFNVAPEVLDYVMRLDDIRKEQKQKDLDDWKAEKAKKEAAKQKILDKVANNHVEASQREVVASHSKLVPFSGQPKVTCSDIGIGKGPM